ncbi:MAG TPA: cache domain-containing protein [Humibacter sp.]|nr:cache domain-containing protein [Humibacter sp.]
MVPRDSIQLPERRATESPQVSERRAAESKGASAAHEISALIAAVFDSLESWRTEILSTLGTSTTPAALDDVVSRRVLPLLTDDALLIGAGFIASPDYVHGRDVHFAWWLGPLESGPIFGSTQEPTRLDLSTRGYADYLRDVRGLEWYATPAATMLGHVTGPYVDHLCTCDYILTLTLPVLAEDRMLGVIGADIAVRRLEREVIPVFLTSHEPLALVNADGRVVVSGEASVAPGSLVRDATSWWDCAGTPLRVVSLGAIRDNPS